MERIVYLDNAATTKPFDEVCKIFCDCQTNFYNPSALYDVAVSTKKKIESARTHIAELLGGENGRIVFTSGATEADNMALNIVKFREGKDLVVSVGEHPAIYEKAKQMERTGVKVLYIPLDSNGRVDINALDNIITKNTLLVSVMMVSNETGAINDIKSITKKAKQINPNILVHVDGVQAVGKIKIDLMDLGVDLFTISAHKIHGPKGIGALWVKDKINIVPTIYGGGQENGYRSGTENVAGILAFDYALTKVVKDLKENLKKVENQRNVLLNQLNLHGISYKLNSSDSPYILSLSIPGLRGEVLVHSLEKYKIYLSTGSACSSKKPDNRTMIAIGRTPEEIKGTIRISFSAYEEYDMQEVGTTIAKEILLLQKKIKGIKNE
ncbi:MAG: cysteine desulfurase [Clostridia bacterium]|nr:cysteine desulfurase [Clostridia bacterium]